MSRSTAGRRSLLSQSYVGSIGTSVPKYIDITNKSQTARSRASRTSLLVDLHSAAKAEVESLTKEQKARKLLVRFGKTFSKYVLPEDSQFNFCLANNDLQKYIHNPVDFWNQWIPLKEGIISAVEQASIKSHIPSAIYQYCENEMNQYAIKLGALRETMPSNKSILDDKFAELLDHFERMRRMVPSEVNRISGDDSISRRTLSSVVAQLEAFKRIVPNEYDALFVATVKDVTKRQSTISGLSAHINSVIFRLKEFLDPRLSVEAAIRDATNTENKLRTLIPGFPIERRFMRAKSTEKAPDNNRKVQMLEQHLASRKTDQNKAKEELASLKKRNRELEERIKLENANWAQERDTLFSLIASKPDLKKEDEMMERRLKELEQVTASLEEQVSGTGVMQTLANHDRLANEVMSWRAKNLVLVSLVGNEQKTLEFKKNKARFDRKYMLSSQLLQKQLERMHMEQLRTKRSMINPNGDVDYDEQGEQDNEYLWNEIAGLSEEISSMRRRIQEHKSQSTTVNAEKEILEEIKGELALQAIPDILKQAAARSDGDFDLLELERIATHENEKCKERCSALKAVLKMRDNKTGVDSVLKRSQDALKHEAKIRDHQEECTAKLEEIAGLDSNRDEPIAKRIDAVNNVIRTVVEMTTNEKLEFIKRQNKKMKLHS